MLTIKVRNVYSYLVGSSFVVDELLDNFFAKKIDGYWFSNAFRSGQWDGRIHFYNRSWHSFPTGLLERATKFFEIQKLAYQIQDFRYRLPQEDWHYLNLKDIQLRDYQKEAIWTALNKGNGIIAQATNAGKTEVGCGIIQVLGLPTIWLTHRKELMYQTAERIEDRLGIKVGKVGDGIEDIKRITVAMVQSLYNRKDLKNFLLPFKVLIIDECHHLGSSVKTFYRVAMKCKASYRFGLSATPLQKNDVKDWRLLAMTGEIVHSVTNQDLIEKGYSAEPKIIIIPVREPVDIENLNYEDAYRIGICENKYRNDLILERCKEVDKPSLIIVKLLEHGRILENLFLNSGFNCEFISGQENSDFRNKVIEEFKKGKIKCLISTVILDEGIDVPNIQHLVIAAGGKSYVKNVQRVGRGLRKKQNSENILYVTDFYDDTNVYLRRHSNKRIKDYKNEGFDVMIKGHLE
ncbi:MAG: hypothetical protein DRP74_00475 [Candidatus Omnitrophota bacterium]|nr:MAG: hypothetical protein DRP74_00475 [Candidatus Omnitrophota bacterium]